MFVSLTYNKYGTIQKAHKKSQETKIIGTAVSSTSCTTYCKSIITEEESNKTPKVQHCWRKTEPYTARVQRYENKPDWFQATSKNAKRCCCFQNVFIASHITTAWSSLTSEGPLNALQRHDTKPNDNSDIGDHLKATVDFIFEIGRHSTQESHAIRWR